MTETNVHGDFIIVNGTGYHVLETDFGPRFDAIVHFLQEANGGRLDFDAENSPQGVEGEKAKIFKKQIRYLQRVLGSSAPYTRLIPVSRFSERLPDHLRERVGRESANLVIFSRSTWSVRPDDTGEGGSDEDLKAAMARRFLGKEEDFSGLEPAVDNGGVHAPDFARKYPLIYGVDPSAIPEETFGAEGDKAGCQAFLKKYGTRPGIRLDGGRNSRNAVKVSRVVGLYREKEGELLVSNYCRIGKRFRPGNVGPVEAFLWKYKEEIRKATTILSARHPGIGRANLEAAFLELIEAEFSLFNETDVLQDLSAADYADSPYKTGFESLRPKGFMGRLAGSWSWRIGSRFSGVPIGIQGLGPLQIIPNLALAAFRQKDIAEAYSSLAGPEDFVDEEGSANYKRIIAAQFDPQKMFTLKAMTWDLQLTQLEKLEGLSFSVLRSPHLTDDAAARELALLWGAREMVNVPDETPKRLAQWLDVNLADYMTSLYMTGHLQGIAPHFEGIHREILEECPGISFGYYQIGGQKVCLMTR